MKLARIVKISIVFLSILIILLAASTVALMYFLPEDKVLHMIITQAETSLKRKIKIESLKYSFRGARLKSIVLYDGMSDSSPVILKADSAEIIFSPLSLLKKKLVFRHLDVENLDITIDYDGKDYNVERFVLDIIKSSQEKEEEESTFKTTLPVIRLVNSTITLKDSDYRLKPLIGTYTKVNSEIEIDDTNKKVYLSNVSLVMPGERGSLETSLVLEIYDKDFSLTGDVNLKKANLKWVYKWGDDLKLPYLNFNGMVNDLTVTRNYTEGNADGVSHLDDGSVLKVNGYCRVDYTNLDNKFMDLKDVSGVLNKSKINLKKFFINFENDNLSFETGDIDSSIADIRRLVERIPNDLHGNIAGRMTANKKVYDMDVVLSDFSYGKSKFISNVNTKLIVKDNRFSLEKVDVNVYGQPGILSIASMNNSMTDIVASLEIKEFKFPENSNSKETVAIPEDMVIRGNVNAGAFYFKKYKFTNADLKFEFKKNSLDLPKIKLEFLESQVVGAGNIDFNNKIPEASLKINFVNLKMQNLSSVNPDLENRIFGNASGTFDVKLMINDDPMKTVIGKADIKIDKGKLVNTGFQNGLGLLLEPLKFKLQDLEFQTIYGSLIFKENGLGVDTLVFNSPDIQLSMNGSMDYTMKGDLNLQMHFNKNFIKDIPNLAFPQFNKYKQGEWYLIEIQVKGDDVTDSKNVKILDK